MDDFTKLIANTLFDGAYRATGYILGPQQLKAFVRSFGEVSLEHLLTSTGKAVAGSDIASVASSWAGVETEIGFHSGEHTEVSANPDGTEITFTDCSFSEACGQILADLIEQGVMDREDLPCMRCSLSIAAINKASGVKAKYKMLQHAPGFRCRCSIHTL